MDIDISKFNITNIIKNLFETNTNPQKINNIIECVILVYKYLFLKNNIKDNNIFENFMNDKNNTFFIINTIFPYVKNSFISYNNYNKFNYDIINEKIFETIKS